MMRWRKLAGGLAALAVGVGTVVAFTGVAVGGAPNTDVVGIGLFNCATVTGEIGFSPVTITGGGPPTQEMVSIWFQAKKCKPVKGTTATPVPKSVIGSESFLSVEGNGCPQLSPPTLGVGTLNLAYNFPPVPGAMIDPSVATGMAVDEVGPNWTLGGVPGSPVQWGSYVSPNFMATLHPLLVGAESCATGVTSMWINHGTLSNV